MTLKVFVGSTAADLRRDCRAGVIFAVKQAPAEAVVMEEWDTTYEAALPLCLKMLDGSTHYIGLFGYYRGWVPDGTTASITEAEFDHAATRKPSIPIAIFIPEPNSDFARELERRAREAGQGDDALALQKQFLKRVAGAGTVQFFLNATELGARVSRRMQRWADGSLVDQATSAQAERPQLAPAPPRVDVLAELGRGEQMTAFAAALDATTEPGAPRAACVLVHGPAGAGHEHLVRRLRRAVEGEAPAGTAPRTYTVSCNREWETPGLASSLLPALGAEIQPGWQPPDVAAVGARLGVALEQGDVVLTVTHAEAYPNGVAGFLDEAWRPLAAALPPAPPYRLVCLLTHEGESAPAAWAAHLRDPDARPVDAARAVALPALGNFRRAEVLRAVRPLAPTPQAAELKADQVMQHSQGGLPVIVFADLGELLSKVQPR